MLTRKRMNRVSAKQRATFRALAIERQKVVLRSRGMCECGCVRLGRDVHHVIKRSQGGADDAATNLVYLSRFCHERTDWPYTKGRLAIINVAPNQFSFRVIRVDQFGAWALLEPSELE